MAREKTDAIHLSVSVTVTGSDFDEMLRQAKVEGAALLHRFLDQVYIITHSAPAIHETTRFVSHFDEPGEIESWTITATIGIKDQEQNLDGEPPSED